jgi:hypothetical protein
VWSSVHASQAITQLLHRPFSDFLHRAYYRLFIAPVHNHGEHTTTTMHDS